jgi:hypothetical protein
MVPQVSPGQAPPRTCERCTLVGSARPAALITTALTCPYRLGAAGDGNPVRGSVAIRLIDAFEPNPGACRPSPIHLIVAETAALATTPPVRDRGVPDPPVRPTRTFVPVAPSPKVWRRAGRKLLPRYGPKEKATNFGDLRQTVSPSR